MKDRQPPPPPTKPIIKGKTKVTDPLEPCDTTHPEHLAILAMVTGEATKDQQFLVIEWLKRASGVNEMEFRLGGEDGRRSSDFSSGKRFVGIQLFTLARTQPSSAR